MKDEFCNNVIDDLDLRRVKKNQEKVWNELSHAIAALGAAEVHLLKANIAMEGAKWSENSLENVRTWARQCEEANIGSSLFMALLKSQLDYEDPSSSEEDSD